VHEQFPHFDSENAIRTILRNPKHKSNPESKYYGMTADQIRDSWAANALDSTTKGTLLHFEIECFYNQDLVEEIQISDLARKEIPVFPYKHSDLLEAYDSHRVDPDVRHTPEWSFFLQFVRDFPDMEPFRTEWMIFDEALKIAGSIDMVFCQRDPLQPDAAPHTLMIYDWKRAKEIKRQSFGHARATNDLLRHIPDSNFWHYSLQLNLYKAILQRQYGYKVTDLYLVRLHENNPEKTYDLIKCADLQREVGQLFAEREKFVAENPPLRSLSVEDMALAVPETMA